MVILRALLKSIGWGLGMLAISVSAQAQSLKTAALCKLQSRECSGVECPVQLESSFTLLRDGELALVIQAGGLSKKGTPMTQRLGFYEGDDEEAGEGISIFTARRITPSQRATLKMSGLPEEGEPIRGRITVIAITEEQAKSVKAVWSLLRRGGKPAGLDTYVYDCAPSALPPSVL